MKLPLDTATIEVFGKLCKYGLKQQFEEKLFEMFYRSALESLIIKLHKASTRILKALPLHKPKKNKLRTATVDFTPAEALNFKWTLEFYNAERPSSYEYALSEKYFSQPLNQIL